MIGSEKEKNFQSHILHFVTFIQVLFIFCVCVGVMYSGEYDVCDVTLSI
jgi:hypothetical protein